MRSDTAIDLTNLLAQMPVLNAVLLGLAVVLTVTATILMAVEVRLQLREAKDRTPTRPLSVTPAPLPED